jgi:RNA polymerase sigma factor (sigma-70 family)
VSSLALIYESDNEIINDYVATGSDRAATAFVRKYQKFVYATALRYLDSYDDADDAAQDVFLKALKNLKHFRGEANIKTWLYRITANVCSNMRRKKKFLNIFSIDETDDYHEILADDVTPDKLLESKEFEMKFMDVLSKLPEKQRETFALRYYDDMSYEEISNMLGTTVGGLKANYFQAVQKITKALGREKI